MPGRRLEHDSTALAAVEPCQANVAGATLPFPFVHRRPIFLSGLPRTGTTWVATAFSRARGTRFVNEPITQTARWHPKSIPCQNRYLTAEDEDPEYTAYWRELLSPWTLFATRRWLPGRTVGRVARKLPVPARLLVKEVACSLSLEWIERHLGMQVLITTRHPCGFVASSLRMFQRGHGFWYLKAHLAQPRLMDAYFPGQREWLESLLEDRVSELAAVYGMTHRVLADQLPQNPNWTLAHHEDLCTRPEQEFRRLCNAFDIDYATQLRPYIKETTNQGDGEFYSDKRVSREEPDKWKRELSSEQIETIASIVEQFDLPYYRGFA